MKNQNIRTGKLGEDLASVFLIRKGYRMVERNFRTRFGEIDIVCYDKKTLVFVEVKTKIGRDFGEPEEMVNSRKLSQVMRMGEVYLQDKGFDGQCRVDVVAVVLDSDMRVEEIRHHEAVY